MIVGMPRGEPESHSSIKKKVNTGFARKEIRNWSHLEDRGVSIRLGMTIAVMITGANTANMTVIETIGNHLSFRFFRRAMCNTVHRSFSLYIVVYMCRIHICIHDTMRV